MILPLYPLPGSHFMEYICICIWVCTCMWVIGNPHKQIYDYILWFSLLCKSIDNAHIYIIQNKRVQMDKNVQMIVSELFEKLHNTFYSMYHLQMLDSKVYNFVTISVKFLTLMYDFIPSPKNNNLKNIFSPLIQYV